MKVPHLRKKPEIKSCHNITWEDNYSWIHQKNILEVLTDKNKLEPEVKEYLLQENKYTEYHLKDTKNLQKKLFDEVKARIKLDDESLPYKDHTYEYWTKTTIEGNYSIKLRRKIETNKIEEIWNGDKEKEKLGVEYFGVGDLEVSHNDKYLAYSLDTKGSYTNTFISNPKHLLIKACPILPNPTIKIFLFQSSIVLGNLFLLLNFPLFTVSSYIFPLLEICSIINITCSATATALAVAVIAKVKPFFLEAFKSILSYPTPCLEIILRLSATSITSLLSLAVLIEIPSQFLIFFFKNSVSIFSTISNS